MGLKPHGGGALFSICSFPQQHLKWLLGSVISQVVNEAGRRPQSVLSCALDRISSYTVSLLKRHYSIDDVLSRASFLLRLHHRTLRRAPTACSLLRGGPSNRYHYWVSVMVRVPRLSLNVIGSGSRTIVQRCTCGGVLNNKVCYSETFERLVSSISGCVKVVLMFWMVSLDVFKQQLACLQWWSLLHNGLV